jgi:UDP-galactose transporter
MPLVDGVRYHTSTSVLLNEVIKLAISATVALYEISTNLPPNTPALDLVRDLVSSIFANESWKLAVPAALYTLQNSLQYVAVSNLDPSTFQVTYQLKILTTAVFSVMLLGRTLSPKRWASLLLLIAGVSIVQMPQQAPKPAVDDLKDTTAKFLRRGQENAPLQHVEMNRSVGLIAVLISCVLSGLAGVIFEKVLKESASAGVKPVSLWVRNCQLSFWSLFPALFLGVMWVDGSNIAETGFFAGYNWVVWTAIGFQAAGGIIVALVIKYADNIAKNFATSISIIVSALASAYFFDFVITISVSWMGLLLSLLY